MIESFSRFSEKNRTAYEHKVFFSTYQNDGKNTFWNAKCLMYFPTRSEATQVYPTGDRFPPEIIRVFTKKSAQGSLVWKKLQPYSGHSSEKPNMS